MPSESQQAQLICWYQKEYRRRTRAVRRGAGRIDWLDSGTRVSLTEVRSYADSIGVTLTPDDVKNLIENI
jgi:hypothetical protein